MTFRQMAWMANVAVAASSPYFELWENRSGNLIADFDTEEEALQFVRDAAAEGCLPDLLSWSLHRSDAAAPIAYGKALYALASKRLSV